MKNKFITTVVATALALTMTFSLANGMDVKAAEITEDSLVAAAYMLSLTSKVNAEIVSSNEYSITIKYTATKTFDLKIFGKVIYVTDKKVVKSLNERGSIVEWNNPLINSQFNAQKVADWLANYYKNNIEYEYDTRGNPELDPLDIVYQENDFVKDMQVQIYDYTLNFNQAFSGKITARRIGG